jgi:hypothetical protein
MTVAMTVALMRMKPLGPCWLLPCVFFLSCVTTNGEPLSGTCAVDDTLTASCNVAPDGGVASLGLVGYSCTGTGARPDLQAKYVQGVPQGIICADKTPLPDGGVPSGPQSYCCTSAPTTCAYNPAASCPSGTYDYQCQNLNRPESYNPSISCGQGVRGPAYVDYCCAGSKLPVGCNEFDGLGCAAGLVGWQCPTSPAGVIPRGQDLMANKSRADQYYLVCSTPVLAPSGKVNSFCCYPPAAVPPGGSCVEDVNVPGCATGRFGFACYGPEAPSDDYPPMNCPDPGFAGISMEGYSATLYCCDFE